MKSEEKISLYGYHKIPLKLKEQDISLTINREGNVFVYRRECGNEKIEKILMAGDSRILINPVEPLNKPKDITSYLCVEFKKSVVVEPKIAKAIYLTFPVEIGVFIAKKKYFEPLDVLTVAKQKFTLYGDPRTGTLCKYWQSEVYLSAPDVNPLCEGVIELSITNSDSEWAEVTKSIFNAYGMRLYYDNQLVCMKAYMKISNSLTAEVEFIDSPLKKEMKKSIELYTAKKLHVVSPKFVMREGL